MRYILLIFLGITLVTKSFGVLPPVILENTGNAPSATRIAFVVGNDVYEDKVHFPTLKVCKNDADSMAKALKECGFYVISCKDGNRKAIMDSMGKFIKRLPEFDVALFYYSGHGTEMDGRNYIIPTDLMNPKKTNEVVKLMFKNAAIDIQGTVMAEFAKRQEKYNFLIIDACRISLDDFVPGAKSPVKSENEGFSKPDQKMGTTVVYATGRSQKSFESKGENSIFTNELLRQILIPNVSYRDVFMKASQATMDLVAQHPNDYVGLQQPQVIDMIFKNFQFVSKPVQKEVLPTIIQPAGNPVVVKPAIREAEDLTRYQKADLSYGYMDPDKNIAIPAQFELCDEYFHDERAFVVVNKKYGYINKKGRVAIKCDYDKAYSFSEGLGAVYKNGLWGFLNPDGNIVVNFQFVSVAPFSEGLAAVKVNDKYGFIDKEEKLVLGYNYDEAGSFFNNRACIKKNGRYGFIDRDGKIVIPCIYEEYASFKNGYARVKIDDRILTLSPTGEVIKEVFLTNRY